MSDNDDIKVELAEIKGYLKAHLPGIHERLDRLSEIPLKCAKNDERIDSLEREHRAVKRGVWGVISGSVVVVLSAIASFFAR